MCLRREKSAYLGNANGPTSEWDVIGSDGTVLKPNRKQRFFTKPYRIETDGFWGANYGFDSFFLISGLFSPVTEYELWNKKIQQWRMEAMVAM